MRLDWRTDHNGKHDGGGLDDAYEWGRENMRRDTATTRSVMLFAGRPRWLIYGGDGVQRLWMPSVIRAIFERKMRGRWRGGLITPFAFRDAEGFIA